MVWACGKNRWAPYGQKGVTRLFSLGTVFFRTALPCSGCYYLERGGMQLHDAVGINCNKGATTENQGAGVKFMAKGCMLDDCMCVIWFDMTLPSWWRGGRKSRYYYIIIIIIIIIIIVSFWQANTRPKQGSSLFEKKKSTIRYGYRKRGTHARVFSKYLRKGTGKTKDKDTEQIGEKKIVNIWKEVHLTRKNEVLTT